MKLRAIKKLEGILTLRSGLHIGAGDMDMHIGGTDQPVVKHPHTLEPYIPGSSLKGKVRSLLEMQSGLIIYTDGEVIKYSTLRKEEVINDPVLRSRGEKILKIFGTSGGDVEDETHFGPTRVSFADCYLNEEWKRLAKDNRWLLTEEKSENSINRIQGTAYNPRFIERVPEGAKFDFLVTFKILEEDDEDLLDSVLLRGLKLLEHDALGGNGSRGYGRIELRFNDQDIDRRFRDLDPFWEETGL